MFAVFDTNIEKIYMHDINKSWGWLPCSFLKVDDQLPIQVIGIGQMLQSSLHITRILPSSFIFSIPTINKESKI